MPTINNGHLARIKTAVKGFYNLDKASYSGKAHTSYTPTAGSERGDYTDVLRNAVAAVDAARAACPEIAGQITIQRQAFLRNGSPGWRPTLTVYSTGREERSNATSTPVSGDMAAMANLMSQMTQMLQAANMAVAAPQQSSPPEVPSAGASDTPQLPPPTLAEQSYG